MKQCVWGEGLKKKRRKDVHFFIKLKILLSIKNLPVFSLFVVLIKDV